VAENVERVETGETYVTVVANPEGKRSFGRHSDRGDNNNEMCIKGKSDF
jgi:hypothetical protein